MKDFILSQVVDKKDVEFLNLSGHKSYWWQGYKGQGIKVAVIDTGCNDEHEEFDGNVELARTIYYGIGKDDNGHGTHVCGTIAGKNVGMAPECEIVSYKALDLMGSGNSFRAIVADIIEALSDVVNRGDIDIVSMSIGLPESRLIQYGLLDDLHEAVKDCVNNNIAVIVSCGNDADNPENLYPAFFEEVISVGAVDEDFNTAWFTSVSEEVDVCQVGVDVYSAWYQGGYKLMNGTSMACPAVTGLAVLLGCKYKQLNGNRIPEPLLYEMIKMNCIDVGVIGEDDKTGVGFFTLKPSIRNIEIIYDGKPLAMTPDQESQPVMDVDGIKVSMPLGLVKVDNVGNEKDKLLITARELMVALGHTVFWSFIDGIEKLNIRE